MKQDNFNMDKLVQNYQLNTKRCFQWNICIFQLSHICCFLFIYLFTHMQQKLIFSSSTNHFATLPGATWLFLEGGMPKPACQQEIPFVSPSAKTRRERYNFVPIYQSYKVNALIGRGDQPLKVANRSADTLAAPRNACSFSNPKGFGKGVRSQENTWGSHFS